MDLKLWKDTKKERGMTYQDISDRSGLKYLGTIKNIFAGYTPDPRESTIKAIEQALGVATRLGNNSTNEFFNEAEKKLLEDFRSLPRAQRAQAAEYVRYLAERFSTEKNKKA